MAKLAVVFFAALAFQAAFGGVPTYLRYGDNVMGDNMLGDYKWNRQLDIYQTGKFDNIYGQLNNYYGDFDTYFQKTLPNDRFFYKTLVWQSRELVQYIDVLIHKLQPLVHTYQGEVNTILLQVVGELREIQQTFVQIISYTEVYDVAQLKTKFHITVKDLYVQIQKLWRLVESDIELTQGGFDMIIKDIIYDFLHYFKNFRTNFESFGLYGEQTHQQLVFQIRDVTRGLIQYLQGYDYVNVHHLQLALRQYVHFIETILVRLQQVQGTVVDTEINMVFQQLFHKLRMVHDICMKVIDGQYTQNFDLVKIQLVKELELITECFEQLVQFVHIGTHQVFIREILGDYFHAIQLFRYYVQPGYQGLFGYQGFWGKYGLTGQQHFGNYFGNDVFGRQFFGGNYGMETPVFGRQFFGGKYGMETPVVELYQHIHSIVKDLYIVLQHKTVFNQEMLFAQVRNFAQMIKMIINRLEGYEHIDIIREVIFELRGVYVSLEKLTVYNVFTNVHQLKMELYNHIQIVLAQFEKLIVLAQRETYGDLHFVIKTIFHHFLNGLYDFYTMVEQGYGYGMNKYDQMYGKGYGFDKMTGLRGYGKMYDTVYDKMTTGYGLHGLRGYGKMYDTSYDKMTTGYGLEGLRGYGKMYDTSYDMMTTGYGLHGLRGYGKMYDTAYTKYDTLGYGQGYKNLIHAY